MAAAGGAAGVSAYLGYLFVTALLTATGLTPVDVNDLRNPVASMFAHSEGGLRNVYWYSALVFGFCVAAALPVTYGLWARRGWARDGAYGIFGLPGVVLTVFGLAGMTANSPTSDPQWGLLAGLVLLAVTALVAAPGTGRDFERVAKDREIAARQAELERRARAGAG